MGSSVTPALPLDEWSAAMKAAIEEICDIGARTLDEHSAASDDARRGAEVWSLEQRGDAERSALEMLFDSSRRMLEALGETRQLLGDYDDEQKLIQSMGRCSQVLGSSLSVFEVALLEVRHLALDLLRWTQRTGFVEGSDLPAQYRASYGTLISYAPVFAPEIEAMRNELLDRSHAAGAAPEYQSLLSALSRYTGVIESARGFVRSVVDPPLELVFHETDTFDADWQRFGLEEQRRLATEFNDCCQLMLYDLPSFNSLVDDRRSKLAGGLEGSLLVLPIDDTRVVFTVDEDPVFGQLNVTLFRVVPIAESDTAVAGVAKSLYRGLAGD